MKRILLSSFFLLLFFISSNAEINIGNSFEWLCADAGLIASGKLKSYTKTGSDNNLWQCTFETIDIFKGTSASPVSFSVNYIAEDSLKKYVSEQTPMLIFLKENTNKNKKNETSWHIMESCNSVPAFINLNTPQQVLVTAHTFSILSTRDIIVSACRVCLKKISEYEVLGNTVFLNYLEVPYQTPAFSLLYSGSSCFLIVPDFMFPDSKEKLY